MSIPNIVEITHAIYQGLFTRRMCKDYVEGKMDNASGINLCCNFAFACTLLFSPRVITWLESAI